MREIIISMSLFKLDFPDIYIQMIKELTFSMGEIEEEELCFYYRWSIFPVEEDDFEHIETENIKHNLLFEDRLEHELYKIGMEVYINYENYIRGLILDEDDAIPDIIIDDLIGFIINTMRYEQNFYLNKDVIDSIPNNIHSYLEIDTLLTPELSVNVMEEFNTLDEILDKINKHGIESLTINEKSILKNISKK